MKQNIDDLLDFWYDSGRADDLVDVLLETSRGDVYPTIVTHVLDTIRAYNKGEFTVPQIARIAVSMWNVVTAMGLEDLPTRGMLPSVAKIRDEIRKQTLHGHINDKPVKKSYMPKVNIRKMI